MIVRSGHRRWCLSRGISLKSVRGVVLGLALGLCPWTAPAQDPAPAETSAGAESVVPSEAAADPLALARYQLERLEDSEQRRRETARQSLQGLETRCQIGVQEAAEWLAEPPGEIGRQQGLDFAFANLEDCAMALHQWLRERRLLDPETEAPRVLVELLRQGQRASLATGASDAPWQSMQARLEVLVASRRQALDKELDEAVDMLLEATRSRWRLASKVSPQARARSAQSLFTELQDEIEVVPPILERRLERVYESSRRWPTLWMEVLALRLWLWEAMLLIVFVLLWRRGRKKSQDIGQRVVHWMGKRSHQRQGVPAAMALPLRSEGLTAAAAAVWVAALDSGLLLLIYVLLLHRMDGSAPWLCMVLLAITWRTLPALATLTIASPIERRPAFMVGNRNVRDLQVMTSRSVVGWALVSLLIVTFVRQGLVGYRLYELALLLTRWSFLVLVIFLLDRWAPVLRHQMRRLGDKGWSRWLANPARGRLANIFKAACAAIYLCLRVLLMGISRFFGGSKDFSWWTLRLARSDLQEDQLVREPLELEIRQRILDSQAVIAREDDLTWLGTSLEAWQQSKERDLAAIIGPWGAGKSFLLDSIEKKVASGEMAEGLRLRRWCLDQRLFGAEEALGWLLQCLLNEDDIEGELGEVDLDDALEGRQDHIRLLLEALPPSLFLLDDMHYLVMRAVGGFDAFKAVKRCMYESANRHFWVLTCYQPAWSYLEAVAVDVNLDLFRTRLTLTPWKEDELASWLSRRTEQAGFEIDYSRLVRRGPLDEESDVDLERARQAYWQLLTSASSGNPEVATLYWLDSLCQESGDQRLAVNLFAEPSLALLSERGDTALFVLAALWMHGRLDTPHLASVLNISMGTVETNCRFLDSIDMVNEKPGLGYALEGRWRPPVERLLRQRHFVYWKS